MKLVIEYSDLGLDASISDVSIEDTDINVGTFCQLLLKAIEELTGTKLIKNQIMLVKDDGSYLEPARPLSSLNLSDWDVVHLVRRK